MHVIGEIASTLVLVPAVGGKLIEQVGSYAGFASIIGLAVLAALYFSQARDVKRLREWAGRAPERSAEVQAGGRTPQAAALRTAQPGSGTVQRVGPAQPGQPAQPAQEAPADAKPAEDKAPDAVPAAAAAKGAAATPAGAAASAAGAAPATASAGGATAAPPATQAGNSGGTTATPPGTQAGNAGAPAPGTQTGNSGGSAAPAQPSGGNTGTGAKVLPARPAQPPRPAQPARPSQPARPRQPQRPVGSQTAVIPPQKRRERVLPAPRYLALMVAGVLILGLGGTVGVLALTGNDNKSSNDSSSSVSLPSGKGKAKGKKTKKTFAPAIDPKTVTVAVINGTSITGLARQMSTKVTDAGFTLGTIATASQEQRAESVVLFKPGAQRQARAVGSKVGISQIQAIDAQNSGLAGAATVVVVVGQDKAGGQ